MTTRFLGERIPRSEDQRLLTGRGLYTDDIGHDAAQAVFVRSEHAHARIVSVDIDDAAAVVGVLAIYTYEDLSGSFAELLPIMRPHPGIVSPRTPTALASGETLYAGQPIAMVVARDRYVAEDAAAAIRVEYKPLPAVVGLAVAADGTSTTAHSDMADNLCGTASEETGDVDAALAKAAHVFEWHFEVERAAAMPIETRCVVATYDWEADRLRVHDTTQAPLLLRGGLAGMFGLDVEAVEVVALDIGGGFGQKVFQFYPEEVLIPWASKELRIPVKWTEDRREHFGASNHQRKQIHDVRVGCDKDGRLTAFDLRFMHDSGAYCQFGMLVPLITIAHLAGPYAIPNLRYELRTYYTNTVPTSPYRGAGMVYAAFTIERTMDSIARELGIDRAEIRRRNFVQPEDFPHSVGVTYPDLSGPAIYDSGNYPACLERALEAIDYKAFESQKRAAAASGRLLGLGLACYVEAAAVGPYEGAKVNVLPSGMVTVATGSTPAGQGHATTYAQIAADELGVPFEQISVTTGDSRRIDFGMGTYGSRSTVAAGSAVRLASRAVREKAAVLAARFLEAAPDDIELVDGTARVKGSPQAQIPLAQLATASLYMPPQPGQSPGLCETEYFGARGSIYSNGVHAAVIEIDPSTYDVSFLRYVVVHDCGTVINPLLVDGQVFGGVAHGIADSYYERIAYDEIGQIQNASFMDYLMPYATEIPPIEVHHVETPSPLNELGAKGAGEGGTVPVGAVLASAVENALTLPIREMPLSPLKLFELMEAPQSGAA